jgi:hypothetical protein
MIRWAELLALGLFLSCGQARSAGPLRVEAMVAGSNTRLVLLAAPGYRINSRLEPALELAGDTVIRFHGSSLTSDSSYFATPPIAILPGRRREIHGTLRASICDPGAEVCRTLEVSL